MLREFAAKTTHDRVPDAIAEGTSYPDGVDLLRWDNDQVSESCGLKAPANAHVSATDLSCQVCLSLPKKATHNRLQHVSDAGAISNRRAICAGWVSHLRCSECGFSRRACPAFHLVWPSITEKRNDLGQQGQLKANPVATSPLTDTHMKPVKKQRDNQKAS